MQMAAGVFKAKCLGLMDYVNKSHDEVVITKHGKAIAKLVSLDSKVEPVSFGYMSGEVKIKGDIIESVGDIWDAEK